MNQTTSVQIFPYEAEATSMSGMRRDDIIWTMVITLIAVTINPILKSIGLLPADVFRSLGIFYPGLPQIVFGPLMAFLLLLLFLKTAQPLVFPRDRVPACALAQLRFSGE